MQYSKLVLQHFTNPKNQGRMKNPDGVGMVGNPACGDIMTVYIKIKKLKGKPRSRTSSLRDREIISDIKFETLGCAAAIATSSMITQLSKGKEISAAEKITRNDVADSLEGLPPAKMHCSNLASDALRRAIKDYRDKQAKKVAKPKYKKYKK